METLGDFDSLPVYDCLLMVLPLVWSASDVLTTPELVDGLLLRIALTKAIYILDGTTLSTSCSTRVAA